jgi:hypothetical protein
VRGRASFGTVAPASIGEDSLDVFGLPLETTLLVFGFPAFWVVYTLLFLRVSRSWRGEGADDEDAT